MKKSKVNKENKKEYIEQDTEKTVNFKFAILAIIAIIIFSAALVPVTLQNDTYYTIKIGEHILKTGGIDFQDVFSWHENLTYFYPHWLYDLITYLIYSMFGLKGIFATTVILSSMLGVTIYCTNVQITKNRLISFLVSLGTMYMLKSFIAARAQLVTFILFELEILCIERFLKNKKVIYGIFLFLIALIIANVHSAVWPFFFVLFLPYLGEYIFNLDYINAWKCIRKFIYNLEIKSYNKKIDKVKALDEKEKYLKKLNKSKENLNELQNKIKKLIESREKRRSKPYRIKMIKEDACKWLILIMLACVITGFLTPIKDMPFTYTYRIMQGNTTESIGEHLPLTLINYKQLLIILAAVIALLCFTDTKIRLKDLFMLSGLTLLMFMTRRQMSMFYIFGGAVIAKLLSDLFGKYDNGGSVEFERVMNTWLGRIATLSIILLIVFSQVRPKIDDKFVDEGTYPVQAAQYIKENLDLEEIKLFNEYNYGSYLLFEGIPVFIDSRCDLYTPQFNKTEEDKEGRDIFTDYIKTSQLTTDYEKIFEKYGITHIITYKNSKLNLMLSKEKDKYMEIYSDSHFYIYKIINVN